MPPLGTTSSDRDCEFGETRPVLDSNTGQGTQAEERWTIILPLMGEVGLDELQRRVRAELVELRQNEGLSLAKLQMGAAPTICRLPSVDDEMERRKYPRPLAAECVIRCAGDSLPNPHRLIVRRTMNMSEGLAETLTDRRKDLCTELCLAPGSNFDRKEEVAYLELTGRLITEPDSPCGRRLAVDPEGVLAAAREELRQAQAVLGASLDVVSRLLADLVVESNLFRQEEIVGALTLELPRLAGRAPLQADRTWMANLVTKVLQNPEEVDGPSFRRTYTLPPIATMVLWLADPWKADEQASRLVPDSVVERRSWRPRRTRRAEVPYWDMRMQSIAELALAFRSIERRNGWATYT